MDTDEAFQKLMNVAFRLVSFRPRSQAEIRQHLLLRLKKWKINNPELLNRVLYRLTELGYLNDQNFAAWWIASSFKTRKKGEKVIKLELRQKGIAVDIIETQIAKMPNSERKAAIRTLVIKKLKVIKNQPRQILKQKLLSYFYRHGFDTDTAGDVIDEVLAKDYNTDQENS